jgi:hypothetical protein
VTTTRDRRRARRKLLAFAALLVFPFFARAQGNTDHNEGRRVFSNIGGGVRAIRRGPQGQYYILVAPSRVVLVFDSTGKQIGQVPAKIEGAAAIVYGVALDVDQSGRLYVADRGGDAVNVYAADGSLQAHVHVPAPMGVAALPDDTFAVPNANGDTLLAIYDFRGTLLRKVGELIPLVDDTTLNNRLNLGHLASDNAGNLYFAFTYVPEPTVRKYDKLGYLVDEMSFGKSEEFKSATQAAQREIARARKGAAISPHDVISALGVDSTSQEIWLAFGDLLLHFDRDGRTISGDHTYFIPRTPLAPAFIFVEPDRLLLGSDPLGIYEFARAIPAARVEYRSR